MRKIGVAILGLGVVGGGTAQILLERREIIKKEYGVDVELKKVLVRDIKKSLKRNIAKDLLTEDYNEIINDPNIQIIAECIGGIEPAKSLIISAIEHNKTIVTANKEMFSKNWLELEEKAKVHGVGLYYEASCGGGIPIIRSMTEALQANDILEIKAIINGTTNYILSRMEKEDAEYLDVLKDAQALGYAEANPTADVEGFDASYKLSILSTLAFNRYLNPSLVFREGITKISKEDIKFGKKFGFSIKLLAIAKIKDGRIESRVHPVFVKTKNPLASVNDSFNAVMLKGNNVGDLMFYGRGAGDLPTGSAIVSDIVFAARREKHARYDGIENVFTKDDIISNFESEYYLNMTAKDEPGVVAKISAIFADNNISIISMYQDNADENNEVPLVIFTHKTLENNMMAAVEKIKTLSGRVQVNNIIRVEK